MSCVFRQRLPFASAEEPHVYSINSTMYDRTLSSLTNRGHFIEFSHIKIEKFIYAFVTISQIFADTHKSSQ